MQASRLPKVYVAILALGFCILDAVAVDFVPIPLTSDSFNQDMVVEKTAPPPLVPVTTASMDAGTNNTGFSWYERGYNADWAATGLPVAGSIYTSELTMDHDYQFAPSYQTNNAVLIDSGITNASLTFVAPVALARLSFLVAGGNGGGPLGYTVHHLDNSVQTGTTNCPDWFLALNPACTAYGRVDVTAFFFDGVNNNHPGLFPRDITLSNSNSPVTRIDFGYAGGNSHNAVFAVSGAANAGDPFTPVAISGYNADLVVEASATRRGYLSGVTTATMDNGAGNTGRSWYEQGYYAPAPGSGLPAPASTITSALAPDHRYRLASSFASNNAALVNAQIEQATLTPATPAAYAALSLLAAAGHGPVTNRCIVNHADGTSQTNAFILPDWLDASPGAFTAHGVLNLNNRMVDTVLGNNARLTTADLALANTTSPVTSLVLEFLGGAPGSQAAIFALSGRPNADAGERPVLTISPTSGGALRIVTSQPGQLQSAVALKGTNTVWLNEGPISTSVVVSPVSPGKFYRVVKP